jgi:hypothetical protein
MNNKKNLKFMLIVLLSWIPLTNANALVICSGPCASSQPVDQFVPDWTGLVSDGSDLSYTPSSSEWLYRDDDGYFNFTDFYIPEDIEVTLDVSSGGDLTTYLLVTGDINIAGILNVEGGNVALVTPNVIEISGSIEAVSETFPWGYELGLAGNEIVLHTGSSITAGKIQLVATGQINIPSGADVDTVGLADQNSPLPTLSPDTPIIQLANIPEPATFVLMGLGLAGIGFTRKKR